MPSDVPSQAQLARLSILNLHSLAAERQIPIPKQALDLEVRAIVARHLHGGTSAAVGVSKCSVLNVLVTQVA